MGQIWEKDGRCDAAPVHQSQGQDRVVVTSPRGQISSRPPDRMLKARTFPKADNIISAYIVENTYSTDSPIIIVWWNASDLSAICL